LVGTKYDHFVNFPREEQEEISNQVWKYFWPLRSMTDTRQAKRFARAMKASLIFSSTSHSINVQKVGIVRVNTCLALTVCRSSRLCFQKPST
jgi:GTP-binding protein of the ras superfamily involved in termination of M-phase